MKKIIALLLACVMVLGLFAACGGQKDNGDEIPTITWYQVGGGMPVNHESWTAKVNAYLEEKIGVHLNLQCVGWGEWGDKRSVLVQTNADYDIMFTDMGSFNKDVAMGAFAPMDEYLAEVPGLTDLIPADYLNACRVDGKLYGIPAYKDSSMTNFFVWTKDVVEANFPGYADAHTLADIYEGLKNCVANSTDTGLLLASNGLSAITGNKYDACTLGNIGIGIAYNGGTEFVPVFEQEDVLADLAVMEKMYKEGLINSDAAVLNEASGMCIVGVAQGWPSAAKGWGEGRGTDVVVSQFENTVVSNDTVMGSMACINASSEHKLEAMKLLELVNTDTKLRDMLWYGEEGVNFEYVEENGVQKVQKLENPDGNWTLAAYTQGTFFVATPEVGSEGYGEVKEQNANAIASPAMGFIPDTSALTDKIAALQAVWDNYCNMIMTGTDISMVDQMMADMRAAGFDEVLTEINAQYAEWKAGK